eukprot:4549743-Pleurochrysis_carterae.AAC.1
MVSAEVTPNVWERICLEDFMMLTGLSTGTLNRFSCSHRKSVVATSSLGLGPKATMHIPSWRSLRDDMAF